MAVYKLFPEKDATLYSEYPVMNTGIDEIVEASTGIAADGSASVTRFLTQFNQNEIIDVLQNKVSSSFAVYFKTSMAKVSGLGEEVNIYNYPVSGTWQNGTGKFLDSPETQNGVSWRYRTSSGSGAWATSFGSTGATGSYITGYVGGGNWYTSSLYAQSASFQYRSDFDLSFNVTPTVLAWYSQSIVNNGFITKQDSSEEFDTSKTAEFKYFSVDTNTIYPPQLEFRWADFTFNTGSSTQTFVTSSDIVVTLPNNTGYYEPEAIQRFRVNARPQFPPRIFSTSSFYTTNYYLPTASYWSLKDLDTDETVIDFDTQYTKISADSTSNYFDVYMDGLEPERYYKILIKTIIAGTTQILDSKYYFKVVNG